MSQISDQPGLSGPARKDVDPRQSSPASTPNLRLADASPLTPGRVVRMVAAAIVSWAPSALVVGGLVSLAWFGHHNDWKVPKFALSANSTPLKELKWCDAHGVPDAECINCVTGLVGDPPKLPFCAEHGVHGCVLHNPSLAETKQPVMVLPSDLERAARALALRPRRENLVLSRLPGSRIQFATIDAMRRAGVDVEPVERRDITECITTAGEILYDATKLAHVSPPVDGVVRRVGVNVGDWVDSGRELAIVDSEKVGGLKSALLSALSEEQLQQRTVSRLEPAARSGAVSGKRLLEAKAALQQAVVAVDKAAWALRNLGLKVDSDGLRSLDARQAATEIRNLGIGHAELSADATNPIVNDNWIEISAPLEGRVVERNTTVGEVVDRGSGMFRICDTRTMWLDLRVAAEVASLVKVGQEVRYRPDGTDSVHRGRVIWISSDVDAKTRTVRVRAELANPNGELRNESFGAGEIVLRDESDAIVVPSEAVQWDGENTIVFVRDKRFFEEGRPKFFVARSIRVGVAKGDYTEIIAGVLPGEVVATSGSNVLRAQLLKSNLGAGCTCGQ